MSYGFFDSSNSDRVYSAEDFRELISVLANNGVNYGTNGGSFAVTAQSPNAMYVDVAAGACIVNGGWLMADTTTSLAIAAASSTYGRYDAVVVEFDASDGVRAIELKVIQGTAASTPEYPTLTQTATIFQLPIAFVYVGVNASSISDDNITDVRGNDDYCDWQSNNYVEYLKENWKATTTKLGGVVVGDGINVNDGTIGLKNATTSSIGGVIIGDGLQANNGTVSLKNATQSTIGGVIIGDGIDVNDGEISLSEATESSIGGVTVGDGIDVNSGEISLSNATDSSIGGVIVGNGLEAANGTVSVKMASRTELGGVIIGSGLDIDEDGVVFTTGGGGGGGASYFRDLGDVDIDYLTLESGQVPMYNADTDTWDNASLPEIPDKVIAIVTVTAEDYAGIECTLTNGTETYTETLDSDGVATFEIIEAGTYTATANGDTLGTADVNMYDITLDSKIIYGFKFDATKSDPSQMVSYEVQYDGKDVDNINYTPVQMDLSTGVMDAGSWNLTDDFFIPKSCMLNYDGTVAYYLDEDDETKRADGTSSDVANTSFGGNAMMEWGRDGQKIYMKIVPDDTPTNGATFYISNAQVDADFKCLPFYDCNGNEIDHFYTPKYNGSLISNKLRSISGQTPCNTQTGSTEETAAEANNVNSAAEWGTEVLADRMLINSLLLMLGKNANTQAVYGQGYTTGGSAASSLASAGTLNGKGQWYGSSTNNSKTAGVKVFGMEHWWGNIWRRTRGLVDISGTVKYKMTYSTIDGSSGTGYNNTGSGYKTVSNGTPGGTSGGYISASVFNEDGIFAKTASGSETTYFCDGLWFNNSQSNYALVGGDCGAAAPCGAFAVNLDSAFSSSNWNIGASLSCKPLAA